MTQGVEQGAAATPPDGGSAAAPVNGANSAGGLIGTPSGKLSGSPSDTPRSTDRQLFFHARDHLIADLAKGTAKWLAPLRALLLQASEQSFDPQHRAKLTEVADRLGVAQSHMAARLESLTVRLSDQALERLDDLASRAQSGQLAPDGLLTLMTLVNGEINSDAKALARLIANEGGQAYANWLARNATVLSTLGGIPELDELHPLGAQVLAQAILSALRIGINERNGVESVVWDALQPWIRAEAKGHALDAIQHANQYLRSQSVLRYLDDTPGLPTSTIEPVAIDTAAALNATSAAKIDSVAPAPLSVRTELPQSLDKLGQQVELLGTQKLAEDRQLPQMVRSAALGAIKGIETDAVAFAHRKALVPYSRAARQEFFHEQSRLLASVPGMPSADAVLDVIAGLFDYAIDDQRMPELAKPLMWRLQLPVSLLALLDSRYLAQGQRSVRDLVENLAAIVTGFPEQMQSGNELFQRIETAVRAVEIVASMLHSRAQVLSEQVDKHFKATALQMQTIANRVANQRKDLESTPKLRNRRRSRDRLNRDAEQAVTLKLESLLKDKLSLYQVSDSVSEFLRNIWIRHLRTALLRDGESSGSYNTALRVVDDLLWSADLEAPRQSRRQLSSRIPPLISTLTNGIKETGAQEIDYRAFFDELYLTHLRKLQGPGVSNSENSLPMLSDAIAQTPEPISATTSAATSSPRILESKATHPSSVETVQEFDAMARTAERLVKSHENKAAGDLEQRGSQHLLEILSSVDTDDADKPRARCENAPENDFASIEAGMWMELLESSIDPSSGVMHKVAWINRRRTVFLLLRYPDRRPLSINAELLLERMRLQTAYLLADKTIA